MTGSPDGGCMVRGCDTRLSLRRLGRLVLLVVLAWAPAVRAADGAHQGNILHGLSAEQRFRQPSGGSLHLTFQVCRLRPYAGLGKHIQRLIVPPQVFPVGQSRFQQPQNV